jgi:16S rRNA (cytidine1402-2'-O)-methyltransferase
MADLAPRAVEVLAAADLILAEDTRRTGRLLAAAGVAGRGRLHSFHEHNEERRVGEAVAAVAAGGQVALVSDAGTPALSDPGYTLVRAARAQGLTVWSVPGPSAFTAALAAAGQPPLPATLVGFLPPRAGARARRVVELAAVPWSVVVFLSPHRLGDELAALAAGLGPQRPATLLAELSKRHERAVTGTLAELAGCAEVATPRGEYVVVVGPEVAADVEAEVDAARVRALYDAAVAAGASRREALRTVSERLGLPRRATYALLESGRD